jgi:hypothetical protein
MFLKSQARSKHLNLEFRKSRVQTLPGQRLYYYSLWFSSQQEPGQYLKFSYDRFLPNALHFISHQSSYHSTLYSRSYANIIVK